MTLFPRLTGWEGVASQSRPLRVVRPFRQMVRESRGTAVGRCPCWVQPTWKSGRNVLSRKGSILMSVVTLQCIMQAMDRTFLKTPGELDLARGSPRTWMAGGWKPVKSRYACYACTENGRSECKQGTGIIRQPPAASRYHFFRERKKTRSEIEARFMRSTRPRRTTAVPNCRSSETC